MEQWTTVQEAQITLRSHHDGLALLRSRLQQAKLEIANEGYASEGIRTELWRAFSFWDDSFAVQCLFHRPPKIKADNGPCTVADDKEAGEKRAAVVALIDRQLEKINQLVSYASERAKLTADADARSFSLPADASDKILRYESHLDGQLYRAIDQLERLQRRRGGENVPPPVNINLGRRS
jgi:hypothetical protein